MREGLLSKKARLVAQGYTQKERIDYDEVFAPVTIIEAIRLFLAYASFMGFTVYQIDVKSTFLYGTIDEEVYVMQPPRFQNPKFPVKVYKMKKAMYGLHQAPRAWYGTLSKYLLTNGFQRGTIDQTLFIRRQRGDFILVQVYVDDIIFGSSNLQLCREFEALMHEKFQMSAMGDILKKFRYLDVRSSNTPMDKENPWGKDELEKIYLKGHPKLGLWYPNESPFDLVAYSDSDYGGATLDRKSTTRGCQFLGRREVPILSCKYWNGTSKYWGVLRILMISLRLIPLSEHNVDFHPIVDFVEASPLRYALTFKPTVYVSHIRQFWSTARIETTKEGTKILATVDGILRTVTESSLRRNRKLQDEEGISFLLDAKLFENPTLMGYNISPNQKVYFSKGRARIAQSSAFPPVADKPTSPLRDVSQGEAGPTNSGFGADQDKANISKTSTLPHDSAPRVTSLVADEGSMQQTLDDLTALCTSLQRQHSEMVAKFEAQELEINMLKAKVKLLEDRSGGGVEQSGVDAPIKGRNLDEGEAAAERWIYSHCWSPAAEVPTASDVVPTAGLIFAIATVVTPYIRRKGKETMVESKTPKKKKVQEQIDAQVARELEEQMARKDQRMSEQVARDAEIVRIHAEEELQIMIDGLDMSNEIISKYLQEYHQFASELPLEIRIKLISDLVRYQDNYAKVHKYQSQQRKPWSKKKKRDYYMAVIKCNLGWKVKDFRGMTFAEIEGKFTTALVKESLSIRPPSSNKEMELWVELKRLSEPDDEDQLWTHTQNLMHAPVEWKLYDMCGVHQVTSKDKQIFMLVEKDYPLRKDKTFYSRNLIAAGASSLGVHCWEKMHKAFPLPVIEFPLPEEVPTSSEESSYCQKKREATAVKIALLLKSRRNSLSKSDDSYAKSYLSTVSTQAEEFDLMEAAANLDEIKEVNANYILMANLQQALTSDTQTDKAPIYDSDESVEVHNYENCYDYEIFNMFTQEEQYTELLEPIPESHQVPQNDNNVISEVTSVEQSRETIEQHPANVEETRALYDSLYQNLAIEVEKVNMVNRKLKETNAELTTELARFKNQEKCFEISQEKYDKLERCYKKSVYQEQCLSKKINALHLSYVTTMPVNVQFLQQLQPEWSRFVMIVKQQHKLDEVSYHKLFDILKQYQNEVNELRAEKLARNANPLALVATAQASQDPFYQSSRSPRSSVPSPKPLIPSRSHTSTRHKGKEMAKPITPPSETASEEDSDPEQAQRNKDMQKNLALIAKYFKKIYKPTNNNLRTSSNLRNKNVDTTPRYKNDDHSGQFGNQRTINVVAASENEYRKPKRVKDSTYHKEKMLLYKQAEQGVPLQAKQYDWLADTDEEVDEQELEAHCSYMAKIQEVPTADLGTDSVPNEQNDVESDDERVVLANLIANSKLDVDENKKNQKQLKKANTTLAQELKECKTILAKTSKSLGESVSVRDSCLVARQTKQAEFEKYKAFNDHTIDYDKLEHLFCTPTALDMEILIQTCLMPLAIKTHGDSVKFVHELKQEMHADLKYVESLEKEIDELESEKAEFSDMYDVILHDCVKECDCLTQRLSKQTKSVSKKVHTELLQRFAKLEKHLISLEIALQKGKEQILQLILFIVDSGCMKYMTGNLKLLCNFVEKFLGFTTSKASITISSQLGNDLLVDNRGSDLYTISLQESTSSIPLYLMAKATPTQAWLWHRRLSHLNFDYINLLSKKDIVIGLPKLKYVKDQLCSSCELGKAKISSFKSKAVPSFKGRLNLLHMDLCGPMRVANINGKKYILVIVDDYSRYRWTLFLCSKDETPEVLKDFLTIIQRNLQALVINVRTDRDT
nr:hypothetical protein [Tanacetum cinerariifolium]